MTAAGTPLAEWLDARRADVDTALQRFVGDDLPAPGALLEAMRYSLFAGGKRLRPMLVLAAAEACAARAGSDVGAARALALPTACAVEMIHTYSLVHDDLPSMDNDTLRRGRPTAHVVYGEGQAILSGDGLLTESFALLAREPQTDDLMIEGRKLRVVRILADAAGAVGMVGGQAIDLAAAAPGATALDAATLRDMHARKTGALIRGSVLAGAVMGGADTEALRGVDAYGEAIGLAFQIVDDILDVEASSAELGKTSGKDAAAGKPTYPALYGLEESKRLAASCVERALSSLEAAGLSGQLPAIARWVTARSH